MSHPSHLCNLLLPFSAASNFLSTVRQLLAKELYYHSVSSPSNIRNDREAYRTITLSVLDIEDYGDRQLSYLYHKVYQYDIINTKRLGISQTVDLPSSPTPSSFSLITALPSLSKSSQIHETPASRPLSLILTQTTAQLEILEQSETNLEIEGLLKRKPNSTRQPLIK